MSPVGFVQHVYPVQITTPFGDSELLVEDLDGEESISGLYVYRLRMVSENPSLAFDTIVGKEASLAISMADGDKRFVHGIVARFRQAGSSRRFTTYFAELCPRLWLLTKTRDSKIYQNETVPDIIKAVLSDHAVTDIKDALTGSYKARDFCVQYQETAFDFISRLMEAEGIAYWFSHTASAHTLVLSDDAGRRTRRDRRSAHPRPNRRGACDRAARVLDRSAGRVGKVPRRRLQLRDARDRSARRRDRPGRRSRRLRVPAGQDSKDGVEAAVDRRLQAFEVQGRLVRGGSTDASVAPGSTFTLQDHPRADFNTAYVVSKTWHHANQDTYSNTFEGFPKDVAFRPPRVTPSPQIVGCQTAMVVGKSGEEIHDRQVRPHQGAVPLGPVGGQTTTPLVLDPRRAGLGRQAVGHVLPAAHRPGGGRQFLDGDPDRPLVTGCVYNARADGALRAARQADPERRQDRLVEGRRRLQRDPLRGQEGRGIFVQAQKDMSITVLNDQTATIKNKRSVTVTGDETHANDANLTYTIKKDLSLDVSGKVTLTVTGDLTLKVTGAMQIEGSKDISTKAGMNLKQEAGTNLSQQAGANLEQEAGAQMNVKGALANVEASGPLVLKGAIVKIN